MNATLRTVLVVAATAAVLVLLLSRSARIDAGVHTLYTNVLRDAANARETMDNDTRKPHHRGALRTFELFDFNGL